MRPAARDFNALFREHVFGNHDIFTARSYADFIRRNDIDLARAVTVVERGATIAALAFGLRAERAWFGLIGVHPSHRRGGIGKRIFTQAIDEVRMLGVRSIELEVSQRNAPTLRMCESLGFESAGELLVWARGAQPGASALTMRRRSERTVGAIVRSPAACWQREPRSIALANGSALIEVPGAYAFVRIDGDFANVLDAGASDAASARELVREFGARVPQDVTLNNEPSDSVLTAALRESDWRVVERQYRLLRSG